MKAAFFLMHWSNFEIWFGLHFFFQTSGEKTSLMHIQVFILVQISVLDISANSYAQLKIKHQKMCNKNNNCLHNKLGKFHCDIY